MFVKNSQLFIFILLIAGCKNNKYKSLGDDHKTSVWVYLSGLTNKFNSYSEVANRKLLDEVGREIGIKFIAIKPRYRCAEFGNKLCWPHNSNHEVLQTWDYIQKVVGDLNVLGYIGFSNGGFFINRLAQIKKVKSPLISIGAYSCLDSINLNNELYLIIGQKDLYHYEECKKFYHQSKISKLKVQLFEHSGGHQIPKDILKNLLTSNS